MKVAYKLTIGLSSLTVRGDPRIQYRVAEFVEAPAWLADQGYHPCVFGDVPSLRAFASDHGYSLPGYPAGRFSQSIASAWKCEVEDEVKLPCMLNTWALERRIFHPSRFQDWPSGTRMFKRIKLLTRLEI